MINYDYTIKPMAKSLLIIIIAILGAINSMVSQENEYKKNSVYISAGTIIFTSQYSISYERTLDVEGMRRLRLKANYGKYGSNGLDLDTGGKNYENHKSISAVLLFGLFEADIGVAFTKYTLESGPSPIPTVDYSKVINGKQLYVSTGIRYGKNDFLIRAGISNLELLYLGVGINF